MLKKLSLAIAAMALCFSALGLPTQKVLTLDVAKKMVLGAEKAALKNHFDMVICVVDAGGEILILQRSVNAPHGSIDVAILKAQTAVNFKRPTKYFQDALQTQRKTGVLTLPHTAAVEGGLPVIVDNIVIGAIGVSGDSPENDGLTAQKGLDAVKDLLK